MQAIILAGGFGTRLRSVLADVPKPMAPIHGKPFLAYLIDYLKTQGITDIILSVHYLREQIEAYFKESYAGIHVRYAIEEQPLGTGGAIVKSLELVDPTQPVFVLNGDTFLKINYRGMLAIHQRSEAIMTMALRKIADCSRYGVVSTENNHAIGFQEQGSSAPGLINAGVYLMSPALLHGKRRLEPFSFERDFLFPQIALLKPRVYLADDYFIDIGIPADYERALQELDTIRSDLTIE
jgi:D-glycero-alpha-D-manno-heptose 1-phosphate guanylyltransferase